MTRKSLALLIVLLIFGGLLIFWTDAPWRAPQLGNFVVRDLTITPSVAAVGDDVLIEYWIENRSDAYGVRTSWILEIDGEEMSRKKDVTSEANSTVKWHFRVTAETPGTHYVSILGGSRREYLTGEFTVTEP